MTLARRLTALAALAAFLVLAISLETREPLVDSSDIENIQSVSELLPGASPAASNIESPRQELRAALANLCSSKSKQSDEQEWTDDMSTVAIESAGNLMQSISDQLSTSSSTEHLHLAALLQDDSASRIELLDRAISQSPNDAFLLWYAVQTCTEERDAAVCDLADWERRLLIIDGQNSESWLRVAANRYKVGEIDAAFEAMRHAATAAETRIYWTETIEMIERGLEAAGGDYAFPERAAMAFGIGATILPRYADYTKMCRQQSAQSADWAYTCLGYGELAENQGKTDIGVVVGRAMQKLALEALGEEDKLAAVEARQQSYQQERLDGTGNNYAVSERLLFSDPTIFSAYLAAIRTHGESGARAYLADETSRLLREQPEMACEP